MYPQLSAASKNKDTVLKKGVSFLTLLQNAGTTVAQWLRCCATNRKVAGSIPAGPSDRTMALGSTQPLTEMSTRSISRG